MFLNLKQAVNDNFNELSKQDSLFYVDIDRELIFEKYLSGFEDPIERQSYNCNCCKSFLRQWSGIVAIIDGKRVSIWDGIDIPEYNASLNAMRDYLDALPITDVFLNEFASCGTDNNWDDKNSVLWNHFHIQLPARFVNKSNIGTVRGDRRTLKETLQRALTELTPDSTDTALDLINQGAVYRGNEFVGLLKEFKKIQLNHNTIPEADRELYYWIQSTKLPASISKIRGTAVGSFLVDLNTDMEEAVAAERFGKMLDPGNYKRPVNVAVSTKQVESAQNRLIEMGMDKSLDRRMANEADINAEDVLFTNRTDTSTLDVFSDIKKDVPVNPRSFINAEEMNILDFMMSVVPTATSLEVLVENSHMNNFVSLITSKLPNVPSLFKWDNLFSWNYTGGITDAIKEKVKSAGGNVDGELRASLSWHNYDDLDLHAIEPNGNKIYFSNKGQTHPSSGKLDVDMNAGGGQTRNAVENIIWTDRSKMQEGKYTIVVHNYALRERQFEGFTVQLECAGEMAEFTFGVNPGNDKFQEIVQFTWSRADGIKFLQSVSTNISSKEKWNLKTNQFHKVNKLMLSPNHWNNSVGNKHFLFFLDECKSDEESRPFFNEFLKEEFTPDRKVFEIMGSKLKIVPEANQLSGLGFSDTQRNHVIVRVGSGSAKRTLRVKF